MRQQPGIFGGGWAPLLLAATLLASAPVAARAQGRGEHILYGDVKVEEGGADGPGSTEGMKVLNFHILLYSMNGTLISRQTVPNNGRYRFHNLAGGHYDVAVELENKEVARVRVLVSGTYKTDFRQDIALQWSSNAKPTKAQTVSAGDFYQRTAANEAAFKRAQQAVDRKAYDQAVELLKQIVASDDKDFQAWTELGTAYLLMKKDGEAERAYENAIKARPAFFLAHFNLGRARAARKQFAEAVGPLTRAVELQPSNAEANFLLGESHLQIKQGSKAVGYLEAAGRLGKSEAHLRLATLYNAVGMKDRAASEYKQFLAKNPDHPEKKKFQQYIAENKKK